MVDQLLSGEIMSVSFVVFHRTEHDEYGWIGYHKRGYALALLKHTILPPLVPVVLIRMESIKFFDIIVKPLSILKIDKKINTIT